MCFFLKKSTRRVAIFVSFSTLIFLASCVPSYVPNTVNTPLHSEKGEIQATINTGISGFDPQLAVAPGDHIGVMVNGSFANRTSDSTDNFHKHNFLEAGVGYFTTFDIGRFEIYGGFGGGNLEANYKDDIFEDRAEVNTGRIFLQPGFGLSTDIIDASLASRFVMVNLKQVDASTNAIYIEPVVTAKLGYKYVKFLTQIGFSKRLDQDEITFLHQPFLFSFGLQFKVDAW